MANEASSDRKGEGRKLRRARNVVKKWQQKQGSWLEYADFERKDPAFGHALRMAIIEKRYERAQALLVTAALLKD